MLVLCKIRMNTYVRGIKRILEKYLVRQKSKHKQENDKIGLALPRPVCETA
jgi:hypothetical protein